MISKNAQIHDASIDRSMSLVVQSWEHDDLSIFELNDQLEALADLVEGVVDFDQFLESANLTGRERLL